LKETLTDLLNDSLDRACRDGSLAVKTAPPIQLDVPKDSSFGDFATNLAMVLSGTVKRPPREIAKTLIDHIDDLDGVIERCEIAGPGFINFYLREDYWLRILKDIDTQGEAYGRSNLGKGRRVLIEFVSANPTGPLHIGHGRGAVVGDALARLLEATGYAVHREFYVNDAGRQLRTLGRSVWFRYRQLFDSSVPFPEQDAYPGEYVIEIAEVLRQRDADRYLAMNEEEAVAFFSEFAGGRILEGIRADLDRVGIRFDSFFSEKALYRDEKVQACIAELDAKALLFREENGALLLRTSTLGDDKDRVLIKGDGDYTYFASDIAYHGDKFARGFEQLVNLWGADHHGYVPRMKSAVQALGHDEEALRVVLIQMVNLLRDGKPVRMVLLRRSDSHLDFDLDLAKTQSNENPVYYVQYAHARICSVFRQAEERGLAVPSANEVAIERLTLAEEIDLMKYLATFPDVVEGAVRAMEPHRIPFYLQELATRLHAYYFKHRIISDDREMSQARLFLAGTVRTVIRNGLSLLGVSAPVTM
jgi:arginyl-tRNA synthetase